MDYIHDVGGVPSEERFQNITPAQWTAYLNHYYDKKSRDREELLQMLEYIAILISSMNPEAVDKNIKRRRNHKKMLEAKRDPENYLKVNSQGQNEVGHHINTTFFYTLKKIGGEAALKGFENPQDFEIDKDKSVFVDEEEEKFIREARKLAEQRKKDIEAEKKFKKEHPELFENMDAIRL